MHHALEISEILLNIFCHCASSHLTSLARTCHTFKEPALDLLWKELTDPSPLARCLPQASRYCQSPEAPEVKCYSFCRSLTRTEWNILQSYTRRILSISHKGDELDWDSVKASLIPPATEPLFPKIRHLQVKQSAEIKYFSSVSFPSLISVNIELRTTHDLDVLGGALESLCVLSPNVEKASIQSLETTSTSLPTTICRWENLRALDCCYVPGVDALVHLSRMPALTHLGFLSSMTLLRQVDVSHPPLSFSNLRSLRTTSDSLNPLSPQIQFPSLTQFTAVGNTRPLKKDLLLLWESIQTSGFGLTIQYLSLNRHMEGLDHVLGFKDLRPCMAFSDLRRIYINLPFKISLTNDELLELVSVWPLLECILLNESMGWETQSGITPDGLIQLLQKCPLLTYLGVCIDTRGYTEFTPSSTSVGFALPLRFHMAVIDSVITADSVPAMAAFFASIAPHARFTLFTSNYAEFYPQSPSKVLWNEVYTLAQEAIRQGSDLGASDLGVSA